jgi:KipI family sensor histidine kinase inhibitor
MTQAGVPLQIIPLGDAALLIELGAEPVISPERTGVVTTLAARLLDRAMPGVTEIVPSYTTLLVEFDLLAADPDAIEAAIRGEATNLAEEAPHPLRRVTIPVCYGGEHGPDLVEVGDRLGLPPDEVAARHAAGTYLVAGLGFSPGWAYLLGLPEELEIPRRTTPRTRVPPGSVAIGGRQTGVYPSPTPGGWWLLGKTPARMFDLRKPVPFVLAPGDEVRFRPLTPDEFDALTAIDAAGGNVAAVELLGEDAR